MGQGFISFTGNQIYTYNGSPQFTRTTLIIDYGTSNDPSPITTFSYSGNASDGTSYGPISIRPTNAGSYTVIATVTFSDIIGSFNSAPVSFTINKATPTISVSNSPVTYNSSAQSATISSSVQGAITNTQFNGSSTVPTNAGTYAVTADFTPTDLTNYNILTGASAGNFVINKVTPTINVSNSPVTYDGSVKNATISGSVAGTPTNIKYNGSSTLPTNAGTYAITADFTPTDATNYNSLTGASAGNFIINKITPVLSILNSPITFNNNPSSAVVSSNVSGNIIQTYYNGSSTAPTNAGTYSITADFVPTDVTNYNSLTGSSAGSFVIAKVTPTLSVTNSPLTYNGAVQTATISSSISGTTSNIKYNGSSTAPTNAGTYSITADFVPTDVTNYNSLTGSSAGNFQINPISIRIIADAVTKTENDPDPPFNYTSSPSLLNSASFTGSLGRDPGETPGDYLINLGSLNAGINYVLSINLAKLTIKPLATNYIFEVPNAFTPNSDGHNDFLKYIRNSLVNGLNYFRIFNRAGQLVFETNNISNEWNGRLMNNLSSDVLTSDLYVWIAEITVMNAAGPIRKTGSVLLLK